MTAAQPTPTPPAPGSVTNLRDTRKQMAADKAKHPAGSAKPAAKPAAEPKAPAAPKQDPNKMSAEQRRVMSRAMADAILNMDLDGIGNHYPELAGLNRDVLVERTKWQAAYVLPSSMKPADTK
jgi:hypothetical protein